MRPATVACARAPAWRPACPLPVRRREGRRLMEPGAPCRIELLFQMIPFPLQPIARALQSGPLAFGEAAGVLAARQLLAQSRNLLTQIAARRLVRQGSLGHATVMPDSRVAYQYDILDRSMATGQDPLNKDPQSSQRSSGVHGADLLRIPAHPEQPIRSKVNTDSDRC